MKANDPQLQEAIVRLNSMKALFDNTSFAFYPGSIPWIKLNQLRCLLKESRDAIDSELLVSEKLQSLRKNHAGSDVWLYDSYERLSSHLFDVAVHKEAKARKVFEQMLEAMAIAQEMDERRHE
jgi:hypothetical protein